MRKLISLCVAGALACSGCGPSPAQVTPCEAGDTYGDTIPGRWLEDVFVDIGAPGDHPVDRDQIGDTGTALSVDTPAYKDGPILYATMLARPFPENEEWDAPEEEAGHRGEFDFFTTEGDFAWEAVTARSDDWQLALIAYPGSGGGQLVWPDGVLDWLTDAVEIAQKSPPRCSPSA